MVNLPGDDEPLRPVGERGRFRIPAQHRSHHGWGVRFGRRRNEMAAASSQYEPKGLLELEQLAFQSMRLMEKYNPRPNAEHNFKRAMMYLRQQYNMNFIIVCESCGGTHMSDELLAPER